MSVQVTVNNAFANAANSIAQETLINLVPRLAEKYGFDSGEALAFLGQHSVPNHGRRPETRPTKNAQIAKNGLRAEKFICRQESIQTALEQHFELSIRKVECIPRKKYDIKITFDNGTVTTLQNKDGGNGRGWSVDRRSVDKFQHLNLQTLLKTVCLKQGIEKPIVSGINEMIMNRCILGESESPAWFTHTTSDKSTGNIISMSICSADTFMAGMYAELYKEMEPKRTCVHLSPSVYLQRKGGGKTDAKPDDIQMKLRLPSVELFTPIFPQTMPQSLVQM